MLARDPWQHPGLFLAAGGPLLVLSSLVLGSPAAYHVPTAPEQRSRAMLCEPEELQQQLSAPGLRLLDTRPRPEYARGHIPGAVWVDLKRWEELGKQKGGLHNAPAWGQEVGRLGIGQTSHVVVYGSSLPNTARVWWMLKYLGVDHVAVLDGGWDLWVHEKRPQNTTVPTVEAVSFQPRFQADRLEEIDALKKSLASGKVAVVDARSTGEFTGKDVRGKRGGHIPGAKHLEWKDLLAGDGRFKSPEQLRQLFAARGIHPDQTAVTC